LVLPAREAEIFVPMGPAARRLGLSPEYVRELCDRGVIAHIRDASNRRLIRADELERVCREREARAAAIAR
jgi:excisionase family DNA binding protein